MSWRFLSLVAINTAVAIASPATAAAQPLDPEQTTPYLWRVVIQTVPHPLLTPAFRDGLRRDLLAALQPAIGPLGTVEVVDLADIPQDQWAPLWRQFVDTGFPALELDKNRDLTGVKTHFLRLAIRGAVYELESRQHDGFTGLATPVVRRQSIRAPELVGRGAGLMVDRDFGLDGTVEPIAGRPNEVLVRLRGGKLGPVDRLVKEGDIFAVARITRTSRSAPTAARTATGKLIAPSTGTVPPPALTPALRDFTLLRVSEPPADGSARCTILSRYQTALPPGPGLAGYRCMKFATVQASVSVRLVGGDGKAATTPVASVRATEAGFGKAPDTRDFLDFQNGIYRSARPLSGVACVTISLGASREALFPLPILGPEPVTLQFEIDAKAEERAAFERALLAASARTADARIGQAACFDAVGKLIAARKNGEALARAKAGFEAAGTAHQVLSEEVRQSKEQSDMAPGSGAFIVAVEQQLSALQVANGGLPAIVKELDAVVVKENDPAAVAREVQAQAVAARINLLLAGGEVDEAIAAYDQLATLLPDDPTVKIRRDKLEADWKPKDDVHAKAREYLLKTWPALATAQDLKDSLPQLRTAVDTCKRSKDRYTFRRLLGVLGALPAKLTDLIKDLDPGAPADLKLLQDVTGVREVVAPLEKEIVEFLKANP